MFGLKCPCFFKKNSFDKFLKSSDISDAIVLIEFKKLSLYAKKKKLIFFSTPLSLNICDFFNKIQPIFKISSGDNNYNSLIYKIIKFNKPTIISTGMLNFNEIKNLYNLIKKKKFKSKLSFLHCISNYPAKPAELNLESIVFLKKQFPSCYIGYSDHSKGIEACLNATVMGAQIIEKHFTLRHNFSSFRDHQLSADPLEMKELVTKVRNIKVMRGEFNKKIALSEKQNKINLRRSLATNKILQKGQVITKSDLVMLRPGSGYSYEQSKLIIGRKVKKIIKKNEILSKDSFI